MLVALNFKNIIAIDNNPKKLALAKKIGSKFNINSDSQNVKEIMYTNFNKLVDICIEAGGTVKTIEKVLI